MKLPPNLIDLLLPETTRTVRLMYYPTRRFHEVGVKIAPTPGLEFNLGCVLEGLLANTLASLQEQLGAYHFGLDESNSSPGKLVFRYQEEPQCLLQLGS